MNYHSLIKATISSFQINFHCRFYLKDIGSHACCRMSEGNSKLLEEFKLSLLPQMSTNAAVSESLAQISAKRVLINILSLLVLYCYRDPLPIIPEKHMVGK